MSFRRMTNATKVTSSYYYSKWFKKPVQWGLPISVSIEPTTACNLGCPECPSGLKQFTRNTGNLKTDFYKETINQLASKLWYLTFYFQGEPYIHPQFLDMVNYASKKRIYTSTSTNAHFLNDENAKKTVESGLDRLIISIDGTTQETYESYRINGSLEKVIEGTENIVKWKKKLKSKTPHVIFQFLVVRPNEHQIDEVKALAKKLNVDEVRLKTAQVYDYKNGNELIPTIDKYSRYKAEKDGTYSIKNSLSNHCWKLWHSCVITWDGLVVPCCFDKDATHQLGDLKQVDFPTLWRSEKYQHFRSSVLRSRNEIDICKNCTEGTKVWA
jgi:radical SAM protein with 4Fe4S-binding SPASM domain